MSRYFSTIGALALLSCVVQCAAEPQVQISADASIPDSYTRTTDTHISLDTSAPDTRDIETPATADIPEDAITPQDTTSAPEDTKVPVVLPPEPVRYENGQSFSPITAYGAKRAQTIRQTNAEHAANVFMKVGDSISYSMNYLYCFAGNSVVLGELDSLADTLNFYLEGNAAGKTPFDRKSQAVLGGKTAAWAMKGNPSPLMQELEAVSPSLAIIMFGTNDSGYFPEDTGKMLRWYGNAMFALVDTLIQEGVVPVLMTIPPRTNKAAVGQLAPLMNAAIKGLAQGRQIPFVDYFSPMNVIPKSGLSNDGVHPNVLGSKKGCHLTKEGLQHGYNLRNALSLEALERARKLLNPENQTWDTAPPIVTGNGSPETPYPIDTLPFTHVVNTANSPHSLIDAYPGCSATQDESGPEWYYTLELQQQTALRLVVLNHGTADVDVHLLGQSGTPKDCIKRNHTLIEGTLSAGKYVVVLDTFVTDGSANAGETLFLAVPCESTDPRCAQPLNLKAQ